MSNLFVFDTNILISAALVPNSINQEALDKAIVFGKLVASKKTIEEFIEVLSRLKFDKYFFSENERWLIINKIEINTKIIIPSVVIDECRDPKDNKFLELAIAAKATCIVTGDNDLLVLNPFRNIPILNAVDFLNTF